MRFGDMWEKEWCTETLPGRGEHDPCLIRTRAFMLENQCEWGYFSAMRSPFAEEAIERKGVYDHPHWSDPVFFAC